MRITKIKVLLLCMLSLLLACNTQENIADTKLTLLDDVEPEHQHHSDRKEHLLISRIYDKEWKWAYVVDEECTRYPYTLNSAGDLKAVLEYVEETIKMWLAPITGAGRVVPGGIPNRKIVNNFLPPVDQSIHYKRGKTKDRDEGLVRITPPNEELNNYVFTIFFHCRGNEEEDGWAYPDCNTCSAHCDPAKGIDTGPKNRITPEIHMYLPKRYRSFSTGIDHVDHNNESSDPIWIGRSGVHRGHLLHEMGHLFGLSDTYYENDPDHYTYKAEQKIREEAFKKMGHDPYPSRTIAEPGPGRMVDPHNEGNFCPQSTMSCDYIVDKNDRPKLAPHDVDEIRRLYDQVRDLKVFDK